MEIIKLQNEVNYLKADRDLLISSNGIGEYIKRTSPNSIFNDTSSSTIDNDTSAVTYDDIPQSQTPILEDVGYDDYIGTWYNPDTKNEFTIKIY